MKLTNINPEKINQQQFEIAQKVLNDWLDASGFDVVTELYLTKFKSNYITWEGRIKFLKEPWLSKFKTIPQLQNEGDLDVELVQIQFVRNDNGWYFDLSGSWFHYWELSCQCYDWFRTGEKNQYDVFKNRVMNCEKKSLQEWFIKFDEYMEKSLLNFRKGFSIVFNKELETDIAEIKKLNEKIKELNDEKQKLYQRGVAKMEKMFAMAEDFQFFVNIILHFSIDILCKFFLYYTYKTIKEVFYDLLLWRLL